MLPKLIEISQKEEKLYQIYKETSYDDASHEELCDAWREANREVSDLGFSIKFLTLGSYAAVVFFRFCCPPVKQIYYKTDNVSKYNEE